MKLQSLGHQTNLIFSEFSGEIIQRSNYLIIRTPSNPGYHWGNYLVFSQAPKAEDLGKWKDIFDREFEYYQSPHHYSFIWDSFKKALIKNYRAMSKTGLRNWFGVFKDNKVVADLGVFYQGEFGRYQSLGTHPEYRRQGYCANLVYFAGKYAFDNYKVETLVMEADLDYHAARVYESVGFERGEVTYSLSWWKK